MNWMATLLAVLAVGLAETPSDAGPARFCIPPERSSATVRLIADPGFNVPIPTGSGAIVFDAIAIETSSVTFTLARAEDASQGASSVLARIMLAPRSGADNAEKTSASFVIRPELLSPDPDVALAVARAVASIRKQDNGGYYSSCAGSGSDEADGARDSPAETAGSETADTGTAGRLPGPGLTLAMLFGAGLLNLLSVGRGRSRSEARGRT